MPFWSHKRLARHLAKIVDKPSASPLDANAVVLRIGPEIYITPHQDIKDKSTHTKYQLIEREPFAIPAGQFAFILTEEFLTIPDKAIGFISVRTTVKFRGLINISGFHVEPGYKGRLIFAVLNAGPSPIQLQQGEPIFRLWLADLDDEASEADVRNSGPNNEVPNAMTEIPLKFIQPIPDAIQSLQSLSKRIDEVESNYKMLWFKVVTLTAIFGVLAGFILRFVGSSN